MFSSLAVMEWFQVVVEFVLVVVLPEWKVVVDHFNDRF